jgi:hypothetical protein
MYGCHLCHRDYMYKFFNMADCEQRKHTTSAGSDRLYEGRRNIIFCRILKLDSRFIYRDVGLSILVPALSLPF